MKVGDTIVIEAEKATQSTRTGIIEEVLGQNPPRVRVRWTDGRTSILAPKDGAAMIKARRTKARAKA